MTSKALGQTMIVAAVLCCQQPRDTVSVSVTQVPATVAVTPASFVLQLGGTRQLSASVRDAVGSQVPGASVTWSSSNPAVATVDETGLVTARGIGSALIRGQSDGAGGQSEVTVSLTAPSEDLFFSDGFETGNLKHTSAESDWRWQSRRYDAFPPPNDTEIYVGVWNDNPRSGQYSIVMQAPAGGEPWFEERFYYNPITRFWVEFYIHIPSNYYHRTGGSGGSQHKFLNFWGGGDENYSSRAGRPDVLLELWPTGEGDSRLRIVKGVTGSPATIGWVPLITDSGPWYRGRYNRFRMQVDMGSGSHDDGIIRVWVADKLVFETTDTDLWPTNTPLFPYFDTGYLLGYSNTGFNEPTRFHIDDWKITSMDPGW